MGPWRPDWGPRTQEHRGRPGVVVRWTLTYHEGDLYRKERMKGLEVGEAGTRVSGVHPRGLEVVLGHYLNRERVLTADPWRVNFRIEWARQR